MTGDEVMIVQAEIVELTDERDELRARVTAAEAQRDDAVLELQRLNETLAALDEPIREAIARAGRATGYAEWKNAEGTVVQMILAVMTERDEAVAALARAREIVTRHDTGGEEGER
jgi:FtsZ-binding cell division protein ZapB